MVEISLAEEANSSMNMDKYSSAFLSVGSCLQQSFWWYTIMRSASLSERRGHRLYTAMLLPGKEMAVLVQQKGGEEKGRQRRSWQDRCRYRSY